MEGNGHDLIEVQSRYLSVITEENYEKLQLK
jgi:hypothetical protein